MYECLATNGTAYKKTVGLVAVWFCALSWKLAKRRF